LGQVALLLLLGAVDRNRKHHQAALHGDEAAQAGVAALELLADQAVAGVVESRAVLPNSWTKHAQLTESRDELLGELGALEALGDERQRLLGDELADYALDHLLLG